jgi:hypothetical protein
VFSMLGKCQGAEGLQCRDHAQKQVAKSCFDSSVTCLNLCLFPRHADGTVVT